MKTEPHATYVKMLEGGLLGYQQCAACSQAVFPPRVGCPFCGEQQLTWQQSAGRGTIYASTVVSSRHDEDYAVVLIDLLEGYRMMSRVIGSPADDAKIGRSVRFDVTQAVADGDHLPFVRLQEQKS